MIFAPGVGLSHRPIIFGGQQTARPSLQLKGHGRHQAFLGIPYAVPPVGEFRWTLPTSPGPFATPYDATRFRAACRQFSSLSTVTEQDEDCLYLNVWRPS